MAQSDVSNFNLQSSYLAELPGGDLDERFGVNSKFEFKLEYLTTSRWAFYLKSGLRIGEQVEKDVFSSLRTEEGFIVGVNGFYADLFGRKRGFDFGLGIDKLINISSKNEHQIRLGIAGIKAHHWIRIVDESQTVAQVLEPYSQLYDHFVSGYGLEENLQFQYNSKSGNAAFLIGLQMQQIFGREHRAQWITEASKNRTDLYFGVKLSYMLSLYTFSGEKTIYY